MLDYQNVSKMFEYIIHHYINYTKICEYFIKLRYCHETLVIEWIAGANNVCFLLPTYAGLIAILENYLKKK